MGDEKNIKEVLVDEEEIAERFAELRVAVADHPASELV